MRLKFETAYSFLALFCFNFLFFPYFFNQCVFAQNKNLKTNYALDDFRRTVFAKRVLRFVTVREDAILSCARFDKASSQLFISVQRNSLAYVHSQNPTVENLLLLLEAYQQTEIALQQYQKINSPCAKLIKAAEESIIEEEREQFRTAEVSLATVGTLTHNDDLNFILIELDPRCDKAALPDYKTGHADTNPCTAGYAMVLKRMKDSGKEIFPSYLESAAEIDLYLGQLQAQVSSAPLNGEISLLNLNSHNPVGEASLRLRQLSNLAFLFTSYGSRIGMSSPYGDAFWMMPLKGNGSLFSGYAQYFNFMNRKDQFYQILREAKSKKLKIKMSNVIVNEWNRHNYMAAFLACEYHQRGLGKLAHLIPDALGIAYESNDFISHLKDGVSFNNSVQNFKEDTARYREGSAFGEKYCSISSHL